MSSAVLSKIHRPHHDAVHKRHVLTLEERIAVLKYLEEHPKASISEVCSRFASNPRTVRRIQEKKDTLLTLSAGDKRLTRTRLTKGTCLPVEACVLKWMDLALFSKLSITNHTLQTRAKFFFSLVKSYLPKVSPLSASNGWINRFKVRNAIDLKELNKLSLESFADKLAPSRSAILSAIQNYSTNDIFTVSTTALFYSFVPTLHHSSPKNSNSCHSPSHLSMYLCSNATGSEKMSPFLISSQSSNVISSHIDLMQSNANTTPSQSFKSWLCSFGSYIEKDRQVLLILDHSFSKVCSEVTSSGLCSNIEFKFLPQYHSNQLQPFNFGIFDWFKSFYRSELIANVVSQKEYPTEVDFASLDVSEVQAIGYVNDAWIQVPSYIIQSAWNSTELLPPSRAFEIPSEYLALPDPFCMVLNAYPYLYSLVVSYDQVDQVHIDAEGQFPTEFEVLVVEDVVACYLETHPPQDIKLEHLSDYVEPKPEYHNHFEPSAKSSVDDSNELMNLSLDDLNYIRNFNSLQFQPQYREPVSCAAQASFSTFDLSNGHQSSSDVLSPELTTSYSLDGGNASGSLNPPSIDQIQNVDMLLQLLKSHLSSGFGAPSDITDALDFVSQYVHRFDGNFS